MSMPRHPGSEASRDQGAETPEGTPLGTITTFRDLKVWQLGIEFAVQVYRVTDGFPRDERFGLTMQVRNCASSVSSNIAEGYGRGSRIDYLRFLKIARSSLYEADSQLFLARKLGFLSERDHESLKDVLDHCERALAGLIRSLENRPRKS